jgi:hypothetical protein
METEHIYNLTDPLRPITGLEKGQGERGREGWISEMQKAPLLCRAALKIIQIMS